jgi:hypothetical protein
MKWPKNRLPKKSFAYERRIETCLANNTHTHTHKNITPTSFTTSPSLSLSLSYEESMAGRESPNERSNNSRDELRSQRYIVTYATLCTRLNKRNKRLFGGLLEYTKYTTSSTP